MLNLESYKCTNMLQVQPLPGRRRDYKGGLSRGLWRSVCRRAPLSDSWLPAHVPSAAGRHVGLSANHRFWGIPHLHQAPVWPRDPHAWQRVQQNTLQLSTLCTRGSAQLSGSSPCQAAPQLQHVADIVRSSKVSLLSLPRIREKHYRPGTVYHYRGQGDSRWVIHSACNQQLVHYQGFSRPQLNWTV